MSTTDIEDDDTDFMAVLATRAAAKYQGEHQVIIEPASAAMFSFSPRNGLPARSGVKFSLTIITGPAKDETIEFHLTLDGVSKAVAGVNADIILAIADATRVVGATPAAIINAAARRLFPTSRNPNPPRVLVRLRTRATDKSPRPFIDLAAIRIEGAKP